jgi:hypothetical protein
MKKRTPEEVISRLLETMGRSAAALEPYADGPSFDQVREEWLEQLKQITKTLRRLQRRVERS